MIFIEITPAINLNGDLQTFYLCFGGDFVTSPADSPPSVAFMQRLLDPGSIGLHAYSDGEVTGGATALEVGQLSVANMDGALDGWLDFSFDGRSIVIRSGPMSGEYPSSTSLLFNGTMDGLDDTNPDELGIRLRDKQFVLRVPALVNQYGGTNVLPNGLDGTVDDLLGKVKPRALGTVFNVTPPQVNTSKLSFQVNDGPVFDIPAVYDGGGPLTRGADFATSALMQAATPAAASYITCLTEGYFRIGAAPQGAITCDVVQGATSADRSTAQILRQLALLSPSITPGGISSSDIASLDLGFPAVVGIWLIDATTTVQGAMDQVAASINAWYGFDGTGLLRFGVLVEPSATPRLDIQEYMVLDDGLTRKAGRDGGIPVWRSTVNYAKNWTVQSSGLIGATTAARRSFVSLATRSATDFDASVKTKYLLAVDAVLTGLLTLFSDAQAEAHRQQTLQGRRRDIFEVSISVDALPADPLFYMDVVSLTHSRYGLSNGRLFSVIGMRYQLADNIIVLSLWG